MNTDKNKEQEYLDFKCLIRSEGIHGLINNNHLKNNKKNIHMLLDCMSAPTYNNYHERKARWNKLRQVLQNEKNS